MQSQFEKSLSQLKNNDQSLTRLDLGLKNLGPIGAQYLSNALKTNNSLVKLDLSYNELEATEAEHLSKALETNQSLTSLRLLGNLIGAIGAGHLSKALETNQSLSSLDLFGNDIGDTGAEHISKALKTNQSLTWLNLNCNQISDIGAEHLSQALEINHSLTSLNLWGNEISDTGVQHLSKALEINQSLTSLNLSENKIKDTGVQHLSKALQTNQSLSSLDLYNNKISDIGAEYLGKALETNQSLTSLKLGLNDIRDTGIQHLSQALEKNQSLTLLDLLINKIGPIGRNHLSKALEKNYTLLKLGGVGSPEISKYLERNNKIANCLKPLTESLSKGLLLTDGETIEACLTGLRQLIPDLAELPEDSYPHQVCRLLNALRHYTELGSELDALYALPPPFPLQSFKEISHYLERNNAIANCLKPLTDSLNKGLLLTDDETIEACVRGLEELIPDLAKLPEDSYPQQAYRLLNALGHYSNSYIEPEARLNALHALLPPFKLPAFQKIADKTLGLLLSGEFRKTLQDGKLGREGLLLSLYAFRNHLHEPETRAFIQIALFQLIEGKDLMVGQKQAFDQNIVILSEYQLLGLLKKALVQLDPDSDEAKLIGTLVSLGVCNDVALSAASQSNTFLAVFKAQYPQAKSFTTIEHCLFTASNQRDSFLIEVHQEPRQEVSADDVETYSLQVHTKSLDNVVKSLKESLGNHRFSLEDKALDDGRVDAMQGIEVYPETSQKVRGKELRQENPLQQFGFFQNPGNEEGFNMGSEMVLQTPKRD